MRESAHRHTAPRWELFVCGVTSLLLEATCQCGCHCKEKLHDREKDICLTYLRDKEMEKHILLQCTNGKDKCTSYEEKIEVENSSLGRRERTKAYPSSHNGSYYKEMTEHKCSMQPRRINNERKNLETLNQY